MPKKTFIIILAAAVALMPFLGFPSAWEDIFYTAAGVLIILFSVNWSFLHKKKAKPARSRRSKQISANEVYVESAPKAAVVEREEA